MKPQLLLFTFLLAVVRPAAAEPRSILPAEFQGAMQPQIAVASSGEVHVVFGKGAAIFHTSSADGRVFAAPVKVGELEKLGLGMRRGPRVCASADLLLVSAISLADGNLHAWTSADRGRTWQKQDSLNTIQNSAREGLHALAGDERGFVIATWLELRTGGMELWSRASRDGGRTWQPEVRVYASPAGSICECCHPSVAIGADGAVAAMWRNWLDGSRDLWLAESTDYGVTFGAAHKLGAGTWKLQGCPMEGGGLTYSETGIRTVWRRETALFTARNSAEKALSSNGSQPVITASGARTFIAWEADGAIFSKVDTAAPCKVAAGRAPVLAAFGKQGRAFLAWEGERDGAPAIFSDVLP